MKRTLCWMLIIGLLISFGMLGCAKDEEEIKIGIVTPLTGPVAPYGENVRDGCLLALEEINEHGGIKLKLIIEDEDNSSRDAVNAVQKLITVDHVPVIIGPVISSGLLAAAPIGMCQ